jgi:hypothetical protein
MARLNVVRLSPNPTILSEALTLVAWLLGPTSMPRSIIARELDELTGVVLAAAIAEAAGVDGAGFEDDKPNHCLSRSRSSARWSSERDRLSEPKRCCDFDKVDNLQVDGVPAAEATCQSVLCLLPSTVPV